MKLKNFIIALFLFAHTTNAQNAIQRLGEDINYSIEAQITASKGQTPLWLNANRYGMSSITGDNGHLRVRFGKASESDTTHKWRIGYGTDIGFRYNAESSVFVQQMYADFAYRGVRLSLGSKERPMALKNQELSSGSQTFGINSHPIPEARIEIPEYISITGKSDWIGIKGHFGYGITTDGKWARHYTAGTNYSKRTLYHTKAGYMRFGNKDKFPLIFEGGLEMACMFGGSIFNNGKEQKLGQGIRDFIEVIFGTGHDIGETVYKNANGNTVGSWLFSLSYVGKDWEIRTYYDHFFEDHSMMFFQYGWLDGLIGAEINLPQNPYINTFVYEFMNTTYQAGTVYHDHTPEIPDQISAIDNYYNHTIHSGWQNWGQPIGNPLFTSPLYRNDEKLNFNNNRFKAHHFGISGTPIPWLHYRLLYSYTSNLGTYHTPYLTPKYNNSFLCEATLSSPWQHKPVLSGWQVKLAFGLDRGAQIGNNTGMQISIKKTF